MAQAAYPDTRQEVEVFAALSVLERHAGAFHELHLAPTVCMHHELVIERALLIECHRLLPLHCLVYLFA